MYRALIIISFGLAVVLVSRVVMAGPKSPEPSDQQEKVLVIPSYDSDDAKVILATHRQYYRPRPYRYYYRPPYRYYGHYYRPYAYRPYYDGPAYGYRYYYPGPGVYYYGPHVQLRIGF